MCIDEKNIMRSFCPSFISCMEGNMQRVLRCLVGGLNCIMSHTPKNWIGGFINLFDISDILIFSLISYSKFFFWKNNYWIKTNRKFLIPIFVEYIHEFGNNSTSIEKAGVILLTFNFGTRCMELSPQLDLNIPGNYFWEELALMYVGRARVI